MNFMLLFLYKVLEPVLKQTGAYTLQSHNVVCSLTLTRVLYSDGESQDVEQNTKLIPYV